MSYQNKERGNYPAIGKAVFADPEAYIKWYAEDGGYKWLNSGDNFKALIYNRQALFNDMVPGYLDIYNNSSASAGYAERHIGTIRKINTYIERIGGRYDVLLHEPEMSAIQFGERRFLIPTRFLTVSLYPDYTEKTLAELNRSLAPREESNTGAQSGAMAAAGSLSISSVNDDMDRQNSLIADVNKEIEAVKAEMEREVEALRAKARVEIQRIERIKLGLQVTVEELQTKVFMLESVIYSVECYLGDTVDFIKLRSGRASPVEDPFVIHQKLRYLDEDLPILLSIYGFRFEKSELFEEALRHRDDLVEYFCPGDKCMSFVRVSKTATKFGINEHGMLSEYELYHGGTIGILLRNGENLYFGWADDAKVTLPDGNVFYTPKVFEINSEDAKDMLKEADYPSRKYSDEQIESMTPEEQKELADRDQIAFHTYQRGAEKRNMMAKVFVFAIIQGVLDNSDMVSIPEKVRLLNGNPGSSKYLIFSNADGWLEDNRYGSFSDILKRFEHNHKTGDVILTTVRLRDGRADSYSHRARFDRSIDGSSRTHDCSIGDCEFHRLNLIQEHDPSKWPYREGESYYVSLEKSWSDYGARSNFEVERDEFINMTFLNSEWLHYAILNKKLGSFVIHGASVSYAHAVRYLKLAHEYLIKRESEELSMICEFLPDLADSHQIWMVALSDWKEMHNVRKVTPYQAKRFAKWIQKQNIPENTRMG